MYTPPLSTLISSMQSLSFTVTCSFTYSDICTDSKLDYCCSVLAGVSGTLQRRLQSVFNAAARLVFSASKSEHVTPLLQELHWLKVPERIQIAATSGDTAPMCDTIAAKLYPSVGTQHWRQKNCKLGVLSRKYWAIDILMKPVFAPIILNAFLPHGALKHANSAQICNSSSFFFHVAWSQLIRRFRPTNYNNIL